MPNHSYLIKVNPLYTTPDISLHGSHYKFVGGLMLLFMEFIPQDDSIDLI
jgi:hypothetical protein